MVEPNMSLITIYEDTEKTEFAWQITNARISARARTHAHTLHLTRIIFNNSTKHFVARPRCKWNPLFHFHDNTEHIFLTATSKSTTIIRKSIVAFQWQQWLHELPQCTVVHTLSKLFVYVLNMRTCPMD